MKQAAMKETDQHQDIAAPPTIAHPTLLFVDDEENILNALRRLFHPLNYRILTAGSGAEALALLEHEPVDLVISDMRMPQMDGVQLLEQVRAKWPNIPRILLTGYADIDSTIAAINRGEISRYITKPWESNDIMLVVQQVLEHKAMEEQIRNLAFYDALTQLPNRRLLLDRMGQVMAASKRSGRYAALMFLDMDNFKPLNDAHGHVAGDLLLTEVARRIVSCVRLTDTVARFGGDEFVVMLGELDEDKSSSIAQTAVVAEKIRVALAEPYLLSSKHDGNAGTAIEHHCTSSIGVVMFLNHEAGTDDLFKWADLAMYQAKEEGRNLVRFFDPQS